MRLVRLGAAPLPYLNRLLVLALAEEDGRVQRVGVGVPRRLCRCRVGVLVPRRLPRPARGDGAGGRWRQQLLQVCHAQSPIRHRRRGRHRHAVQQLTVGAQGAASHLVAAQLPQPAQLQAAAAHEEGAQAEGGEAKGPLAACVRRQCFLHFVCTGGCRGGRGWGVEWVTCV